ncbi:site-specific DNA-methyltransferase (adenine-specific) [Bacillus mesophilus]|uniref:Methyltransferase n=1 Tax=Bacillus mesophilus TaxID=1808955 RepID=A0A6M0Q5U4_9BACI|nr:site-specific DNA-methyltransferase [Bacillus mesophilus]MBM7660412.1 site-specific DNA-methyltransferase (adenine-specific) [Bacillus mesophilus]NEY71119.1 site-specific DNA-methyltransferase [Bacillus mesophilus]
MVLDITIYNKDSSSMSEIGNSTIDLIVTSPPYWFLKDYDNPGQLGLNMTYQQYLNQLKLHLHECIRVLKIDSFICINIADVRTGEYKKSGRPRIYPIQSDLINFFTREMDLDLYQHFIWEKYGVKKGEKASLIRGSVGKGKFKEYGIAPFLYTDLLTEHILVFRKPGNRDRGPIDQRQDEEMNRIPKEKLQEWLNPIWKINSAKHQFHKAIFPDEVVRRLIKLFSLKNDTILDPFCGIGTTMRVANELQRNSIGYELNQKYIMDIANTHALELKENIYSNNSRYIKDKSSNESIEIM